MKNQLHDDKKSFPMADESADWRQAPIDICKGAVLGVGAILPGISGGVLAVVFGIYKPMMTFLSIRCKHLRHTTVFYYPSSSVG